MHRSGNQTLALDPKLQAESLAQTVWVGNLRQLARVANEPATYAPEHVY